MQDKTQKLYQAISNILCNEKKKKGIKYTELCYENDIPTSTYDDIINCKNKASFVNIAKIIIGLGLNFEEFGKMLDKELGENFNFID
ncbi:MAG: hypothetical protein IJB79_08480 [Candidatus Gastranaerophilales bacterium]|nr:hypothetical protein [Candidatus Gastranaerophilales bacterium]